MKNFYIISVVLIYLLLSSCSRTASPEEYVRFVQNPDNGLLVKTEVRGINYMLQYEPVDYCVMLEEKSFTIPKNTFKAEYDRFKGLEHFIFKVSKTDVGKFMANGADTSKGKNAAIAYFDFSIQKDIKLLVANDTIPCSICQVDANTGISPYYTYTLGFYNKGSKGSDEDRVLLFQNKLMNMGKVMLCVKGSNINGIPRLKMFNRG